MPDVEAYKDMSNWCTCRPRPPRQPNRRPPMRRLLPATIGAILIIISYQALAHGYYSPAATCCAVLAATTAAISLRRGAHSPALVAIPSLIAIIAMMIFAAAVTQPATMFTVYMAGLSALMVAGSAILITLTIRQRQH